MSSNLKSTLPNSITITAHIASWAIIPALSLTFLEGLITQGLSVSIFTRWMVSAMILVLADMICSRGPGEKSCSLYGLGTLITLFILCSVNAVYQIPLILPFTGSIAFISLLAILLGLETYLEANKAKRIGWVWFVRIILAIVAAILPVSIAQVESRFSEEELYTPLQVIILVLYYVLLSLCRRYKKKEYPVLGQTISMPKPLVWIILLVGTFIVIFASFKAYQTSFYTPIDSLYPGISPEEPFLCGATNPSEAHYQVGEVRQMLLKEIEQRPNSSVPEYGMLSLTTGEDKWLSLFKTSLLNEAEEKLFTGPANSVKWIQFQAAQRVFFYAQVKEKYPTRFSQDEAQKVEGWFHEINKRTQTAEWVDWLYAVGLSKSPEGPYENQENGAGLLSLLELYGYADPSQTAANEKYLHRSDRGWSARFRNTDDVYTYQMEWLENAYYQSLRSHADMTQNRQLSFEWLLLQSLPDGAPLSYNYPYALPVASTAYWGASLLNDPELLWLAGHSLNYSLSNEDHHPRPVPYAGETLDINSQSPTKGSCLLYGDTGLPNQAGGIAPDKIVFRDGWDPDSKYLLLNLRFTGWHRYKATNTITLLYQQGPLLQEVMDSYDFSWLPQGRSVPRDKRIPRENLNGLLLERTGLNRIVAIITGVGGRYAQNPPHYAEIVSFETHEEKDIAHTRLVNWQGWTHDRWIDFRHDGEPILVMDKAVGPNFQDASIVWHPVNVVSENEQRYILRRGKLPVEMVVIPDTLNITSSSELSGKNIIVHNRKSSNTTMTFFLFGDWVGAEIDSQPTRIKLQTQSHTASFDIPAKFRTER